MTDIEEWCGSCAAGILVMENPAPHGWVEIQRCDECAVFETDEEAARSLTAHVTHDGGQVLIPALVGARLIGGPGERRPRHEQLLDAARATARQANRNAPPGRGWTIVDAAEIRNALVPVAEAVEALARSMHQGDPDLDEVAVDAREGLTQVLLLLKMTNDGADKP